MPTGDLDVCTVQPGGLSIKVRIVGFGTGTTSIDVPAKAPVVSVTSKGYSGSTLTTVVRSVKAIKVLGTPATVGSDLEVELALDAQVYLRDADVTDGSGTDPTIAVVVAWATNTLHGNAAADSSHPVSNSSGLAYPKGIGRFATVPCMRRTGVWYEEVVAYGLHPDSTHTDGVAGVAFTITDSGSNAQTKLVTSKTTVNRPANGFGPAASYSVWRCSFDAGDRDGLGTDFAPGSATRDFIVYPRVGDSPSRFVSSDSGAPVGTRMREFYLDPGDTQGSALDVCKVYVDSTGKITGDITGTFIDREFAIEGSSGVIVKVVADPSLSAGELRFNYLQNELLYTLPIDTVSAAPAVGDLIQKGATHGIVHRYTSGSPNVVLYQLLSSANFADADELTFLRRSAVGEDFTVVTVVDAVDDPTSVGSGTLPTSGGVLTGIQSGATIEDFGAATFAGNDASTHDGSATEPKRTIGPATAVALALKSAALSLADVDGCTIVLYPGDYIMGPRDDALDGLNFTNPGHWTTLTNEDDDVPARITGSDDDATNYGIDVRRLHLRRLIIQSPGNTPTVPTHSGGRNAALWLDECVLRGVTTVDIGFLTGIDTSAWAAHLFTSCDIERNGQGLPAAMLCRDCRLTDIGGDILSQALCVINVTMDRCNPKGALGGLHGDIGQYASPNATWDNIVWFCVDARRQKIHQPVPNNGSESGQTFKNVAIINVLQVLVGDDSLDGGFSSPTVTNVLMWNSTTYGFIGAQLAGTTSLSVRSCFFRGFTQIGASALPDAWFRNNHYHVTSGRVTPGPNASTGGNLTDLFSSLDPDSGGFYFPNIPVSPPTNPLVNGVPSGEAVAGHDVYGTTHPGDKGAVSTY